MSKITIGTRVMFTSAVVRQAGHSARTANMRGDVLSIAGKVATVDCGDTFTSEDVVRHPVVARIVNAYEAWEEAEQKRKAELAAERKREAQEQEQK